jgi:hypothetical protein
MTTIEHRNIFEAPPGYFTLASEGRVAYIPCPGTRPAAPPAGYDFVCDADGTPSDDGAIVRWRRA